MSCKGMNKKGPTALMCVGFYAGQNEAIMESAYGDMGNSIREKHKARRGDL